MWLEAHSPSNACLQCFERVIESCKPPHRPAKPSSLARGAPPSLSSASTGLSRSQPAHNQPGSSTWGTPTQSGPPRPPAAQLQRCNRQKARGGSCHRHRSVTTGFLAQPLHCALPTAPFHCRVRPRPAKAGHRGRLAPQAAGNANGHRESTPQSMIVTVALGVPSGDAASASAPTDATLTAAA